MIGIICLMGRTHSGIKNPHAMYTNTMHVYAATSTPSDDTRTGPIIVTMKQWPSVTHTTTDLKEIPRMANGICPFSNDARASSDPTHLSLVVIACARVW